MDTFTPATKSRVQVEPAPGYRLVTFDFSHLATETEALAAIADARATVATLPPKSVRLLADLTDARMTIKVVGAFEQFVRANDAFVARSAVIGMSVARRVALRQIVRLTGWEVREFVDRDGALRWLRSDIT